MVKEIILLIIKEIHGDVVMNQSQCEDFLESILNIGKLMIQFGGEVWRVEDTISRICKAYNIPKVEVYATNTLIISTIKNNNGISTTQSVRVWKSSNNLGALEALNDLSRNICRNIPDIDNIPEMIKKAIASIKMSYYNCIGCVLAAGAFTIFFGGDLIDGIVAGGIGVIIYVMDKYFKIEDDSKLIYTMITSFIASFIAIVLVKIGVGNSADKIIIGIVMLFIPTLALINGVKDMFYRNISSGIFRIIEAVLVGVTIAFAFGFSIVILGGVL